MIARVSKSLIVLALAGSIGLHWAVLQLVAWTGMMVSYSQQGTITEAVAKTFDGQHPCKLCMQIAKEKQTEKKAEYKFEVTKLEFSFPETGFVLNPPVFFWELRAVDSNAQRLIQSPPVPPPKSLHG